MLKTTIIGGAGYTAGELLRILLYHPEVEIQAVHSNSQTGKLVSDVHTDLVGDTFLTFTDRLDFEETDVIFLCMGHGKSKAFLQENAIPSDVKIIDLSTDFRRLDGSHDFVYGLPELHKEEIRQAQHIANPGCFATAIQLALLPLAKAGLLEDDVHVHAITGSTGAGQALSPTTHFSWRNNNISIYKAFDHQHLSEIRQSVTHLQPDFDDAINFLPLRGNFSRGIFASVYTTSYLQPEKLRELYDDYYIDAPFVIRTEHDPDLKQVVNTNKCLLNVTKHEDKVLIISMLDNLVKGASGQAVQNMNLLCGLEETTGLQLKSIAF